MAIWDGIARWTGRVTDLIHRFRQALDQSHGMRSSLTSDVYGLGMLNTISGAIVTFHHFLWISWYLSRNTVGNILRF